jgi:hypothetical protein
MDVSVRPSAYSFGKNVQEDNFSEGLQAAAEGTGRINKKGRCHLFGESGRK